MLLYCVRALFVVRFKFLVYVLFRLVGWLERGKSVDSIEHTKKTLNKKFKMLKVKKFKMLKVKKTQLNKK